MNKFQILKKIFILFFLISGLSFAFYSKADIGDPCETNDDCYIDLNEVCGEDYECVEKAKQPDPVAPKPGTTDKGAGDTTGGTTGGDTSGNLGELPQKGKEAFIAAGETELTSPIGKIDILNLIGTRIIPAILGFVGVLAVLAVIYGSITYMLSFGNEEKIATGKKIITYACLGILAIVASYMIIQTIIDLATS